MLVYAANALFRRTVHLDSECGLFRSGISVGGKGCYIRYGCKGVEILDTFRNINSSWEFNLGLN